MRLYMPRFYVRGLEDNLQALRRDAAEAAEHGCDAVCFPELFLSGYHGEHDPQRFKRVFAEVSAQYPKVVFVWGAISEERRNRLYVYRAGAVLAQYDKIHLFRPNGEHEMWEPGSTCTAVELGSCRAGLATCNDVRFPEQLRELKLRFNIKLAFYPALWPWRRDHVWAALLRARAIENGIFIVGCCVAGIDNGAEQFDGAGNHVFNPAGDELYGAGRVYELELEQADSVLVDTRTEFVEVSRHVLLGAEPDSAGQGGA